VLDKKYLIYGLNALSRAHQTNYFADGHRGAAIIAAYFLCREIGMGESAVNVIRGMVDEHWSHSPLCAPFPHESPEPALAGRVVECVRANISGLRQAGHNVIFPTLALKAFRDVPEAVTPSRVASICRLVESFTIVDDLGSDDSDDIPPLGPPPAAAEFILSEFLGCVAAFEGRGQGWSGHLLTYGRSVLDLREMGHVALARDAEQAFKIYVKRIRMGPLETDGVWPEHPRSEGEPRKRPYWERRLSRPIGLGHIFKYPYAYCGLMNLAEDARLKQACRNMAYHVL
jgi:hypothetical protein